MTALLAAWGTVIDVVRVAAMWTTIAAALVALLDWAVRTRRMSPFGALARFDRNTLQPLMNPVERRIVRAGGSAATVPWWWLGAVAVACYLVLALVRFVGGLLIEITTGVSSPAAIPLILLRWALGLLQIALLVRVVSSWVAASPNAPWVRWSYTLTEWFLAPLRRVIPPIGGALDITPIVAWFGLSLLQALVR